MSDERKPPRLLLEKLALGELDGFEKGRLEARLTPAEQADALRRLARESEEHLRLHPPALVADSIRAEVRRRAAAAGRPSRGAAFASPARPWRLAVTGVGLAAALAAAVLLVRPALREGTGGGDEFGQETETVKGLAPALRAYRKTATGFAPLQDGAPARPGDLLQLRYQAAGARYGVVVSLDGRGQVTLHYPPAEGGDATLRQGGEIALDHSYELDDAPGFERFVFVTSDAPLTPGAVLEAARALAVSPDAARSKPLPLPPGSRQTDLLVRKTP